MVGGYHDHRRGTVLKGHSIRKAENHCHEAQTQEREFVFTNQMDTHSNFCRDIYLLEITLEGG